MTGPGIFQESGPSDSGNAEKIPEMFRKLGQQLHTKSIGRSYSPRSFTRDRPDNLDAGFPVTKKAGHPAKSAFGSF